MKRLTMLAVALLALPVLAEEPEKKPAASTQTTAATTTAAPAPAAKPVATPPAEESPLVAAARRTGRLGKKPTNVITNETLSKASTSSARITTTLNQPAINVQNMPPVSPTPEMTAAEQARQRRAKELADEEKKKKADAKKEERTAAAAHRAEEGMYDEAEDPDYGEGERDLQRTQQPEKKPPQL